MNINNINPYQGMQNALKSDGGNGSFADNNQISSTGETQFKNLTVVIDPPFLPIATYQRQNLIKKVEGSEIEITHKVSDDEGLQKPISDIKAKVSEMDGVRTIMSEKNQTGAIMSIKA